MDLELTRMFVKVVQYGSFSKAADTLKIPKSTVSKAISRLERDASTQLLLRTTRSLTLTGPGRAYFEACLTPLQALEDARKSLSGRDQLLSGHLKITAPEDLGTAVVSPIIGKLSRKYPALSFELKYSDEVIDLVREGYDLAIRIGETEDSGLRALKIGLTTLIAVAAPSYLKTAEKIAAPHDLAQHACLTIEAGSSIWQMKSKQQRTNVEIRSRIISNQMTSLMRMAIEGAGVALVPQYLCRPEITAGKLVRVLPDWSCTSYPVTLLSPRPMSAWAPLKLVSEQVALELKRVLGTNV